MPRISEFYGIVIAMFYNDHEPPHFHAIYGERRALITIASKEVIAGSLPRRALRMALEWAINHESELRDNWERAKAHRPLTRIAPLE